MCDISTTIRNNLLKKLESQPNDAKYYFSLGMSLGFGEEIALNDNKDKMYTKDQLLKRAIKLDNTNPEYYYELGQFCKFAKQQEQIDGNKQLSNNDYLISIDDDSDSNSIPMGEIDLYLKSIHLINDNNNNNKRTYSKYYISLADSMINNSDDNSKFLTIKLSDNIIYYKKKYLILKAIEYCPERTNQYLHFLSKSNFIKNKNKPIKLAPTNKIIKLKDYSNNNNNSNKSSPSSILFTSIFIILIIINIYYLYFSK